MGTRRRLKPRERCELAEVIPLPVRRRRKPETAVQVDKPPAPVIRLPLVRSENLHDEVLWLFRQARHGST
jgi:hypothetical protein